MLFTVQCALFHCGYLGWLAWCMYLTSSEHYEAYAAKVTIHITDADSHTLAIEFKICSLLCIEHILVSLNVFGIVSFKTILNTGNKTILRLTQSMIGTDTKLHCNEYSTTEWLQMHLIFICFDFKRLQSKLKNTVYHIQLDHES